MHVSLRSPVYAEVNLDEVISGNNAYDARANSALSNSSLEDDIFILP